MKRGDSSYNISAGQGRMATQAQDAFINEPRSTKRSQNNSELMNHTLHRNQSVSGGGHGKPFYKKRLSNNAIYKKTTTQMSRAASALDATQQRSTTNSGFNYRPGNLDRAVRSGAGKNPILLQSHYGLSGNNSTFGFGTKLRGLNSSNNKAQGIPQANDNDHSALKMFAIEQLCKYSVLVLFFVEHVHPVFGPTIYHSFPFLSNIALITQSQYREEERDRQNVIMSDRHGAKKGYGQARSRQKWTYRDDEVQSADTFPQPFMLSKNANRTDTNSMYLRNIEK